ncbi:hypothetical protein PLESTM_001812100 [Pleodorina starrii]|nr:hypothetical protein PLESTM_001812100 [Pleodorina starrii]
MVPCAPLSRRRSSATTRHNHINHNQRYSCHQQRPQHKLQPIRRRAGGAAAGGAFVLRAAGRDAAADAAAAAAAGAAGADTPRVEEPSTALLLAWFACGNRSLFAAQCLVEVLVELYREGRTFGELQLSLKMATQGGRVRRARAAGGGDRGLVVSAAAANDGEAGEEEEEEVVLPPLLQGQEEDVLVSWVALVFLTCEEIGVPRDRVPAEQQQQGQQQQQQQQQHSSKGREAARTEAVVVAAGLVQQSSGAASSPFLVLMQQYTRLVLLTQHQQQHRQQQQLRTRVGLPTARPLRPPETVTRPSGYSQAFSSSCSTAALDEAAVSEPAAAAAADCPARGLAVRLLMAFMGAVLGSQWSMGKFVEAVRVAYDQGLAADELFQQLQEEEFVQSGGLLPIAGPSAGSDGAATSAAAAAPTAADAAVQQQPASPPAPPPPPPPQPAPTVLDHQGAAEHVDQPVVHDVGAAGGAVPGGGGAAGLGVGGVTTTSPPPGQQQEQEQQQEAAAAAAAAEPDSSAPSTSGSVGDRRREGARMVRVEDETLPNTSTAVRVMTQQIALVQAVCRQVMTEGRELKP